MRSLRPRRDYLKYRLLKRFGTIREASIVLKIRYTRLSQICSGAILDLENREIHTIRRLLRLNKRSLAEAIAC